MKYIIRDSIEDLSKRTSCSLARPYRGHRARDLAMCMLGLLFLLPAASNLRAEKERLSDWMTSYYRTRNLSRFDEFWRHSVGKGAFEGDPTLREILTGFFAPIFHEHPDLLKGRIDSVKQFPEKQRDAVQLVLWWSDTAVAREILKKDGDPITLKNRPPGIEDRFVRVSEDIDFCEGWFYATGDGKALHPILACDPTGSCVNS